MPFRIHKVSHIWFWYVVSLELIDPPLPAATEYGLRPTEATLLKGNLRCETHSSPSHSNISVILPQLHLPQYSRNRGRFCVHANATATISTHSSLISHDIKLGSTRPHPRSSSPQLNNLHRQHRSQASPIWVSQVGDLQPSVE